MSVFDITEFIVTNGRPGRLEMVDWLNDNVGEYYGPGEPPVMHIGSGWEMRTDYVRVHHMQDYEDTEISFIVDITDSAKATLFALKWIS